MINVIDRQTIHFCVNLDTTADVTIPVNLRFSASHMILQNITYNAKNATTDLNDSVQIWCSIANDGIIGVFPNAGINNIPVCTHFNAFYSLSNDFASGNIRFQFQQVGGTAGNPANINPQPLISSQNPQRTFGTAILAIEFLKNKK